MTDPLIVWFTVSAAFNFVLFGALISAGFIICNERSRCPRCDGRMAFDSIHGDVPRLPDGWPGKRNVQALRERVS